MSKKLTELQARLDALKAEGLGLVTAAEKDDREFTPEESARLAEIEDDVTETQAEITKINARAEARRNMEAISSNGGNVHPFGHAAPYGENTVHDTDPKLTGGFKDIGEFASCVRHASQAGNIRDERLRKMAAPANYHTGGGGDGEGFMVPPQFRDEIFEVIEAVDEFGPIVDEEPTNARRVEMLADETTPWGSTGVQANWRAEGSQMTASKLVTDNRSVPLHELYAFVLATEELLADAPRMAARLTRRAGEAIAWTKNNAMMRGNGSGKPLGWLSSGALITVVKESGQSADTIVAANVLKMMSRLSVIPGDQPRWLANRNTIPQLATMTIGDQPVWLPPSGLAAAPGGFLLGYPVQFTEHAGQVGDLGDLQLMSPRGYYSLRRDSGAQLATSIHLYFDYAVEAFRWMTRFGGQPHLSAPIDAPTEGGGSANSKSHFVTLAERA